jgi:lipopolysaccharide transport system ATP-binding protein
MTLLAVNNVGKSFRTYPSEWRRFLGWFGVPVSAVEEQWVLRNISFEVSPGSAIGIIGQNGAGKSTLLKLITGTMQPTEGDIRVDGRVASILELGMGFNPDLTGRQNVSHAAGLMGFSTAQIQEVMPEMQAFAEIGDYFDEPVRTYSSGMQMRIAFAVATAYRPDILIVDEALSVGDAYFQHKSFSRITEFQKQGTTLLLVSHDRNAIQRLCSRAILLEKGSIIKDGNPEEVFDFYNALIAEKENCTVKINKHKSGKNQTVSGTGEVRIQKVSLLNEKDNEVEVVEVGEKVRLEVKAKIFSPVETLVMGYAIKDRIGQTIYGTNTWFTGQVVSCPDLGSEYLYRIDFPANLGEGSYSVVVALHDQQTHITANYEWRDLALVFSVINTNKIKFSGCNWMEPSILVEKQ